MTGPIYSQDATSLLTAMDQGRLTPAEVMAQTLDRLDTSTLHAVINLRPRAELMAAAAAAQPGSGPLAGLPVAIKDLAETADCPTTFGAPMMAANRPKADCGMVARLKAAGAIVIGKTNTPEWGLGSHTTNRLHGPTLNPWVPGATAGGSSGGAAAALAARLLPLADGSDMMGSLRNPAGWTNTISLRPSWGRCPADPVGDLYLHRLSTDGPMARSARDLAHLMAVMQADPLLGPGWPPLSGRVAPAPDLASLRIGWLGDWSGALPYEPGVLDSCQAALSALEQAGATYRDLPAPLAADILWNSWTTLRSFAVAARLDPLYSNPTTRAGLTPNALWEVERGQALTGTQVAQASAQRSDWYRAALRLFDQVDILALPTAQTFPFPVDWTHPTQINGQAMDTYHRWMEVVVPASLLGLPVLTTPATQDPTRPMGLQLIAAPGRDQMLLDLAATVEGRIDVLHALPPVH